MADKDLMQEDDDLIVVMTDEEGNEYYYAEEMIIPVGEDKFALLVAVADEEHEHEHHHEHGCDCGCEEADVVIAKIVTNEEGEEEYVEPTDEEFEAVQAAYDVLMDEEEEK